MILLPKDRYHLLKPGIAEVKINQLFARFVIEHKVEGNVYVDNLENPATFFIQHPYGMALLYGDYKNQKFNQEFRDYSLNKQLIRKSDEWLQTYPREWDSVLQNLWGVEAVEAVGNTVTESMNSIEIHTRVNFDFQEDVFKKIHTLDLPGIQLVDTNKAIFDQMPGTVIPSKFWNSADDFLKYGKGFTLMYHGDIASTAYSAFLLDGYLEIGIETIDKYRGKGFAEMVCVRLIRFCLENNLVPVWSCRLGNRASYQLAQKLGFIPTLQIPFYRLPKFLS